MGPVTQDTTIATCFEICTANTECGGGNIPANVSFNVDMNDYAGTFTTIYISGSFNSWSGDANPMTDADGDKIYETTLQLQSGDYEYKFELDNWAVSEQFADGDPCTITDPSGQFVNRIVHVTGDKTVCFEWQTCTTCLGVGTKDLVVDHNMFTLQPTLAGDFTTLFFAQNVSEEKLVRLLDATGTLVETFKIEGNTTERRLETGTLAKGMYLVYVQAGNRIATQKFVKQ